MVESKLGQDRKFVYKMESDIADLQKDSVKQGIEFKQEFNKIQRKINEID